LPRRRRSLLAPALHVFGTSSYLPARELQEPRSQSGHKSAPALVQGLDIPDLRELAKRALNLKGSDLVSGSVGPDIPLHDVPVPETERGFGKGREIPNRIAFFLGRCCKLGDDALCDLSRREVRGDL